MKPRVGIASSKTHSQNENTKELTSLTFNAGSLFNNLDKLDELKALVCAEGPDIIAITDTWLNKSVGNGKWLLLTVSAFSNHAMKDQRKEGEVS